MQTVDANVFWTAVVTVQVKAHFRPKSSMSAFQWAENNSAFPLNGEKKRRETTEKRAHWIEEGGKEKTMWGEVAFQKGLAKERKRGLALEKK